MAVSSVNNSSSKSVTTNPKSQLKSADFIKMMLTQLQNQDPLEPAKNEQLLAQMSQIAQLQSSTDLQTSLKTMVLQNQISSAAAMIGKTIKGMDENNDTITGVVNSIRVVNDSVQLELDSGKTLSMAKVTAIASTSTTSAAA